jgi:hypothetical protein
MAKKKDIFTKSDKELYERLGKNFSENQLFALTTTLLSCAISVSGFLNKIGDFNEIPEEISYYQNIIFINAMSLLYNRPLKLEASLTESELKDKIQIVIQGIKNAYETLKSDGLI